MCPSSSPSPIPWSGSTNPAPIRSYTPEYHLGPVALCPADTADLQCSMLRRRDVNPQLALTQWFKRLHEPSMIEPTPWARSGLSASGTTDSR